MRRGIDEHVFELTAFQGKGVGVSTGLRALKVDLKVQILNLIIGGHFGYLELDAIRQMSIMPVWT